MRSGKLLLLCLGLLSCQGCTIVNILLYPVVLIIRAVVYIAVTVGPVIAGAIASLGPYLLVVNEDSNATAVVRMTQPPSWVQEAQCMHDAVSNNPGEVMVTRVASVRREEVESLVRSQLNDCEEGQRVVAIVLEDNPETRKWISSHGIVVEQSEEQAPDPQARTD